MHISSLMEDIFFKACHGLLTPTYNQVCGYIQPVCIPCSCSYGPGSIVVFDGYGSASSTKLGKQRKRAKQNTSPDIEDTSEVLHCPAESTKCHTGSRVSRQIAELLVGFDRIGCLPTSINLSRLDDGNGIEEKTTAGQAKWDDSCRLLYNRTKLQRAEKRKKPPEDSADDLLIAQRSSPPQECWRTLAAREERELGDESSHQVQFLETGKSFSASTTTRRKLFPPSWLLTGADIDTNKPFHHNKALAFFAKTPGRVSSKAHFTQWGRLTSYPPHYGAVQTGVQQSVKPQLIQTWVGPALASANRLNISEKCGLPLTGKELQSSLLIDHQTSWS
ncbi:hypothetical protein GWK47_034654 [Chionoecetes opilio]|uniref:Uncharacterized protein n=1 Tax=Chionoecetes opilio TaxID=41210 RepID=A0A8J4YNU1_CHIOP|nr:hypothetical protein GWK47_034654 [Chionoecetes opilio]